MTVKEHYDNHLGHFYSWMSGDFQARANEFLNFLTANNISPTSNKRALDLGAGHGLQSIPLAQKGFQVLAVDFSQVLLNELQENADYLSLSITTCNGDIRNVKQLAKQPELIVCCGDTLSHLNNKEEVATFMADIANTLEQNGKLIVSFRDYAIPLTGTDRFIPVKSDENKILTCILDYEEDFVHVTDLLHERTESGWIQKVSSYKKVRLRSYEVEAVLRANGFSIMFNQIVNRLFTIIAIKE